MITYSTRQVGCEKIVLLDQSFLLSETVNTKYSFKYSSKYKNAVLMPNFDFFDFSKFD